MTVETQQAQQDKGGGGKTILVGSHVYKYILLGIIILRNWPRSTLHLPLM